MKCGKILCDLAFNLKDETLTIAASVGSFTELISFPLVGLEPSRSGDMEDVLQHIREQHDRLDVFVSNAAFGSTVTDVSEYSLKRLISGIEYSAWPFANYTIAARRIFGSAPRYNIGVSSQGHESMHVRVEVQRPHDPPAIGLQRAAGVVDPRARDARDEHVCETARQEPRDLAVLAVASPSAHDVVALVDAFEQAADVGGIVLQVAVHRNDDLALGEIEARHHRRGLAEVAAEVDHLDPRVPHGQLVQQLGRPIPRAVVDKHQLRLPGRA